MEETKKEKAGFFYKLANFVVNKRKAILILFIISCIASVFCKDLVKVNQDITKYLPDTSETHIGLTTMNEEFVTYGSIKLMLSNVTFKQAEELSKKLENIDGVKEVTYATDEEHYKGTDSLLSLTIYGGDDDEASIDTLQEISDQLNGYDYYISTSVGATQRESDALDKDMIVILSLSVLIIVAVLFISTKAYAEIPVLLITFGVAALLNMGTNFLLGEISSITNSIAVVLQLALAIDYAIILCDRYMEEHEYLDSVEACKVALSKAIPEISSSSLTTISGMVALMFMRFRLGYDMGIVLVKAILLSLLSVFFLMPSIILIFAKAIDKSQHKSHVPHITFVGKFASATKYIIPPLFVAVIVVAFIISSKCTYLYDTSSVPSNKITEDQAAKNKINETFGAENQLVVMIPKGDYESEAILIHNLEKLPYVKSVLGLANQQINDQYVVTDKLTPRQFAELTDLDIEVVQLLYSAYAYNAGQYGPIVTGITDYAVPVVDMFMYLYDQYAEGYVNLSEELDDTLTTLHDKLADGQLQLKGENYTRLVLNIDKAVEGEETYAAMDEIRAEANKLYGDDVLLVGNSTSARDLESSFATDNLIISILTALFVMIILFFTFQSAGLPVLLVLTIQGSIWINFTVPSLTGQGIYFIAYLIVSAIQMGATIDYAIVISSRYMVLRKEMSLKNAIVETIDKAFPTIFTSGTILTCAGFLIGNISSNASIAAIGIALGRGTLISIILVIFVLPQILMLGDIILEKTSLTMNIAGIKKEQKGKMSVTGHLRGYVNGMVDADVVGTVQGEMQVYVDTRLPRGAVEITDLENQIEEKPRLAIEDALEGGESNE
ncbi:MAG: MMPL family transporter [Lachnospiraceae bacterium]|nr:MMPL family transporter [Lachnospiraceae bacterium]